MKKEYIIPKVRSVDVKSKYGLLQDMPVSDGKVEDPGDIGFSKDTDFDDDNVGGDKGVWED